MSQISTARNLLKSRPFPLDPHLRFSLRLMVSIEALVSSKSFNESADVVWRHENSAQRRPALEN